MQVAQPEHGHTAPSQASHDPPNTSKVNLHLWILRFSSPIGQKGEHMDSWAHNEASSVTKYPTFTMTHGDTFQKVVVWPTSLGRLADLLRWLNDLNFGELPLCMPPCTGWFKEGLIQGLGGEVTQITDMALPLTLAINTPQSFTLIDDTLEWTTL